MVREIDWLIDWTLFLNGEDISTKADSHICRCSNTTNNQDIHSEILLQKDIDKYSISKNKNNREREEGVYRGFLWETYTGSALYYLFAVALPNETLKHYHVHG